MAELTHIPVMTTLAGKSAFPETHPLALGTGAHTGTAMVAHQLQQTDFVLGIGTSFTRTVFNAPMPEGIPLVRYNDTVKERIQLEDNRELKTDEALKEAIQTFREKLK